MSLTRAPVGAIACPAAYKWDLPAAVLTSYTPLAAEADEPNTISMYDVIGEDWWTGEGVTAKRVAGALRSIGPNPVTVNINSPGGNMFEGLAIYNLLAEHPAKVTVRVMGIAASAASIIAMAGDEVLMGTGTMLMVHRAWGMVVGNHHEFTEAAALFQKFDEAMASIYSERTGMDEAAVMAMLDGATKSADGTYMTASEAIDKGFADDKFDRVGDATKAVIPADIAALRRVDTALAKQGVPRRERNALMQTIRGARDAAPPATRDAGDTAARLAELQAALASNIHLLSERSN